MRRFLLYVFSLTIFGLTSLSLTIAPTNAQAPAQVQPPNGSAQYSGLDILFLIDQSGSMGGDSVGYGEFYGNPAEGNDPDKLRFKGTQYALDLLARIRQGKFANQAVDINMAVIAFGGQSELQMEWTPIAPDADNWDQIYSNLTEALGPNQDRWKSGKPIPPERSLIETDFSLGFEAARDLFQNAPLPADGTHLRAIVVLTDGAPCPRGINSGCMTSSNVNDDGAIKTAETYLANLGSNTDLWFPYPGYRIYLITLDRNANGNTNFFSVLGDDWQRIVCPPAAQEQAPLGEGCDPLQPDPLHNELVTTSAELSAHFDKVTNDLLGRVVSGITPTPFECTSMPCTFEIKPYQQFFLLNFFKNGSAPLLGSASLLDPTGATPDITDLSNPDSVNLIETWQINFPEPGTWILNDIDLAQVQGFQLSTTSVDAIIPPSIPAGTTVQALNEIAFQVKVADATTNALRVYSGDDYPLTVTLKIYDASNPDPSLRQVIASGSQLVALRVDKDPLHPLPPDAILANNFSRIWIPDASTHGKFEVRATATYEDSAATPSTVTLVSDASLGEFEIAQTNINWLGLTPPGNSVRVGNPVTVSAQAVDGQGQAVAISSRVGLWIELKDKSQADFQPGGFYLNDPNGQPPPGALIYSLISDTPGEYKLRATPGYEGDAVLPCANATNFCALDEANAPAHEFDFTVRALRYLHLQITLPNQEQMDSQRIELLPKPYIDLNLPMDIQVELLEGSNPVSLAVAAGIDGAKPTLTVTGGAFDHKLLELMETERAGVYRLSDSEQSRLDMGQFTFEASSDITNADLLKNSDFQWLNDASMKYTKPPFSRNMAAAIPLLIGLLLLLIIAAIAAIVYWRVHVVRLQTPPLLKGHLALRVAYGEVSYGGDVVNDQVDIDINFGVNHKILRKRELSAMPQFEYIELSTRAIDGNKDENVVYIEKLRILGQDIDRQFTVFSGQNEVLVYTNTNADPVQTYFIGKDLYFGAFNGSEYGTPMSADEGSPRTTQDW